MSLFAYLAMVVVAFYSASLYWSYVLGVASGQREARERFELALRVAAVQTAQLALQEEAVRALPILHPAEHAGLEVSAGRKLSNEEAQALRRALTLEQTIVKDLELRSNPASKPA